MKLYLLLIAVLLLAGCGAAPGRLRIVDLDYVDSLDVSSEREMIFTFTIVNDGEQACKLQNIFSPDFWKTELPGGTGNSNMVVNRVIGPGEEIVIPMSVYIWDSDTIRDHMKRFAFTLNVEYNDDCPQSFVTREGLVWLFK